MHSTVCNVLPVSLCEGTTSKYMTITNYSCLFLFCSPVDLSLNCSDADPILFGSVADPDPNPDPPDPQVFGPPGSGSTSQRYRSGSGSCSGSRSGSFYHHAKIVRKTLIPTILCGFKDICVYITHYSLDMITRSCSTLYSQWQYLIYTIPRCAYSGNV